ncbi:MAG: Pr6Pr family membrane protein, partial [Acidobacteriota bacterium]
GLFTRPTVQAAVASYITIVGLVYSLFLRSVWEPEGWQAVADHALHDAIPLAAVIYWFGFAPKNGLTWLDPFKWLVYPAIYIAYSLIRGAIVGWYPYWFVDVTKLGYPTAFTNTAVVFAAFAIFGFIYLALSKLLSRTANPSAT